jgi:hypothetical protein
MNWVAGRMAQDVLLQGLKVYDGVRPALDSLENVAWEWRGRPNPPPPVVKQRVVREYGRRFGLHTLIETGTYLGEMVEGTRDAFSQIISIELDDMLWQRARHRFAAHPHIATLHGDSAAVLPQVLNQCREPCLFWLDAHYSGGFTGRGPLDTPIMHELDAIFEHPVRNHVLLIDDARCFNGEHGYPRLADLRAALLARRPDWSFQVENDIMRFHAS